MILSFLSLLSGCFGRSINLSSHPKIDKPSYIYANKDIPKFKGKTNGDLLLNIEMLRHLLSSAILEQDILVKKIDKYNEGV